MRTSTSSSSCLQVILSAAALALLVTGCMCPQPAVEGSPPPASAVPAPRADTMPPVEATDPGPPPTGLPPATEQPPPPPPPVEPSGTEPPAADLPGQGQPCPEHTCATGLTCVTYYGIAGPRGPQFTSCEIPCGQNPAGCPEGQACITIADGPGRVCRPRN